MQANALILMDSKLETKARRNPRGIFEKVPGSGEWWIRYVDASGRYRREKAGSKSTAIDLVRKRKTEALQGKKLPEKLRRATVTFADISRDALAYSKAHKRTYGDDLARMERILGWFRDRSADSITPQEIERHFEQCIGEEEWAASTVNHYRSLLSLTFRLAIRDGKATSNPARATRHRREDNSRVRYLTPEEEIKLRTEMQARWPSHIPELDLALHTGLRLSEMYGLDWQDVDLSRCLILIRRGKNGESRYARLNSVALKALSELRKRGDGTHTFASRLTMAGVGLRATQDALGHKSIAMTVRYSHLAPDFLLNAVEKLVPQPSEADSTEPTDTTTDTNAFSRSEPQSVHMH